MSQRDPVLVAKSAASVAELTAFGLGKKAIADQLGLTVGQVSGLRRRYVLGIKDAPRGRPVAVRPPKPPKVAKPPKPRVRARKAKKPKVAAPAPAPVPLPASFGHCMWPVNDGHPWLFCGSPRLRSNPYCEAHCRVAFPNFREAA